LQRDSSPLQYSPPRWAAFVTPSCSGGHTLKWELCVAVLRSSRGRVPAGAVPRAFGRSLELIRTRTDLLLRHSTSTGCGCNATLRSDWRHGLHPICAAAARARLSHGAAARRRIQFSSPWPRQLRLHLLHGTRAPQAQPVDEQPGRHRARTRATCAGPAWSTVAPERRCRRSSSRGGVRHTTYSGGAPQNNVASSRLHFARLFHGGQRQPGAARGAGG
jgi:hypothetical protein